MSQHRHQFLSWKKHVIINMFLGPKIGVVYLTFLWISKPIIWVKLALFLVPNAGPNSTSWLRIMILTFIFWGWLNRQVFLLLIFFTIIPMKYPMKHFMRHLVKLIIINILNHPLATNIHQLFSSCQPREVLEEFMKLSDVIQVEIGGGDELGTVFTLSKLRFFLPVEPSKIGA